jgi:hypothetical protein
MSTGAYGPAARAAVRRNAFRGLHETGDLVHRFALDAHGQQDAAQFEVGHAPVQDGAVEFAGVLARHAARAFHAAADLLDEAGGVEGFEVRVRVGAHRASIPSTVAKEFFGPLRCNISVFRLDWPSPEDNNARKNV